MKLILGLGNPGLIYKNTWHNIGFKVIERFSFLYKIPVDKKICNSLIGQKELFNTEIILARPLTFMNNSGLAAKKLINKFKIPVEDIIVIQDEIDIKFGRLNIKKDGKSAGHKGIQSIIDWLGDNNFIRVRIGILLNNKQEDVTSFVLSKIPIQYQDKLNSVIDVACKAIEHLLVEDLARTQNLFNKKGELTIDRNRTDTEL